MQDLHNLSNKYFTYEINIFSAIRINQVSYSQEKWEKKYWTILITSYSCVPNNLCISRLQQKNNFLVYFENTFQILKMM